MNLWKSDTTLPVVESGWQKSDGLIVKWFLVAISLGPCTLPTGWGEEGYEEKKPIVSLGGAWAVKREKEYAIASDDHIPKVVL